MKDGAKTYHGVRTSLGGEVLGGFLVKVRGVLFYLGNDGISSIIF